MLIAVHAFDGVPLFHLSVPLTVFGEVAHQGLADWRVIVVSERGGSVRTAEGYPLGETLPVSDAREADMHVVPSWFEDGRGAPRSLVRALVDGHARGASVAGLCLGAFVLAEAGLMEGRSAATHWRSAAALAVQHPGIPVDASVLFIDHGDVLTSAGTASSLDACLHVVRTRLGAAAANAVARQMVVAPHRDGGQAQYIEHPVPERDGADALSDVLAWAAEHLDAPLLVEDLARAAHMSRRSFIRAFRASTGTTPAAWVRARRLDRARELLEGTGMPVEDIARACGFGTAVTMRQGFAAAFGTSPTAYRARFSAAPDA